MQMHQSRRGLFVATAGRALEGVSGPTFVLEVGRLQLDTARAVLGSMRVSRSDLEGAVQASAAAVLGVTDVVESAHATIARPWRKEKRTRGISKWVYRSVRAITRGVARLLGVTLAARPGGPVRESASRDAVVGILNGAFGDTLEAEGNPLALRTELRHD
ncbi:MAG: hypothetical protein WBA11_13060, partial [Rubrivirga sp.]